MSIMDMMGGAPPEQPFSEEPAGQADDGAAKIKEIISLVRSYADQEDDEENVLVAEKITTMLQQILANEQKDVEGMMQGKVSPKALRKAYASGPDA